MKKFYLTFGMLLALAGILPAQYAVTFQVDMGNVATIADTVSVAGDFQVAAGYPADWAPGTTVHGPT